METDHYPQEEPTSISSLVLPTRLTEDRPEYLYDEDRPLSVSLYRDDYAAREDIICGVKKLIAAFPEVGNDYIILLAERMIDKGFTKQRVKDAINHVIDNFAYKRPNISEIISYDKRKKAYTYSEIVSKCRPDYPAFEYHYREYIDGHWLYFEK